MADNVYGRFLFFSENGYFVFEYDCALCGKKFRSRSGTASRPAICHQCFTHCPPSEMLPATQEEPHGPEPTSTS